MSIDFSWLVTALTNVASNIVNFFTGIASAVTQITNTGQGIFAGLANFGGWLYQAIIDGLTAIHNGIKSLADQVSSAFVSAYNALTSGINYIATNLYSFGHWIWAGIQGFINMAINGMTYIANAVYGFFLTAWNTLYSAVTGYQTAVNLWFSNLMKGIRLKIKATIMYSVTTDIAWKSIQRIPTAKGLEDWLFGIGGALLAPIPAYLLAEMLDVYIPTPSTTPQQITPPLGALALPTFELPPYAPAPPTPATPTAPTIGLGITVTATALSTPEKNKLINPLIVSSQASFSETEQLNDVSPTVVSTQETIP